MHEDYFLFLLGLFVFIMGIISFKKPGLFVNKNTPKVHPYFYIDSKKYIKIRAIVMLIIGFLLMIFTGLSILK